jgi:hypothetical protein
MKNIVLIFASALLLFSSCMKEDDAITLPSPGSVKQMTAVMGNNYETQIYVNLETGASVSRPYKAYDLAFEASAQGMRIYLNSGKYMFACNSGSDQMTSADSVGKVWNIDDEQLFDDSLAMKYYWQTPSFGTNGSDVFVIDRGKPEHTGSARWRKFKVLSVSATEYKICFSKYDNSAYDTAVITKDPAYALMYFNFDTPHQLVQQAPPSADWDVVFTKYTHVFFDEPMGSPFRFYPVCGALNNIWTGTQALRQQKDSVANYIPMDQCTYSLLNAYQFSNDADVVGYNWKYYDFNDAHYHVYPDLYFVVKSASGYYYKVRMVDFYNQQGDKGTVTFESQRM